MAWEKNITEAFKTNDIRIVVYLPDGTAASLIEDIREDDYFTAIRLAREEEGVGILSGAWLAHERGALICQSSGLATAINALASLSKPARIPFLGLVTRRGDLGEFNLAQVPFGYNMPTILDDLGIRNISLESPAVVNERVDMAAKTAFGTEEPYIVLLEATLTGAKDEF